MKLTYQWFVGRKKLSGETGRSIRITKRMAGAKISVLVTATSPGRAPVKVRTKAVVVPRKRVAARAVVPIG